MDDTDLMLDAIKETVNPAAPDVKILSTKVKALYGLMRAWNALARKPTPPFSDLMMGNLLGMLATGYRTFQEKQRTGAEQAQ